MARDITRRLNALKANRVQDVDRSPGKNDGVNGDMRIFQGDLYIKTRGSWLKLMSGDKVVQQEVTKNIDNIIQFGVVQHSSLSGVGANDHHAQDHTLASHTSDSLDKLVVDTTTLVVNADSYTDKVGIGTAAPTAKLHVTHGTSGEWAGQFVQTDAGGYGVLIDVQDDDIDPAFKITSGSTVCLNVDGNGKVGIGEAAPAYQLEVRNASGDCDITINCTADGDASLKLGENTKEAYGRVRYDADADMLFLYANNSIRQVIDSAGNVGIGTTTPDGLLEISSSTSNAPSLLITNNSTTADDEGGNLIFKTSDGAIGSTANLTDNDIIGDISFQGCDASDDDYITAGMIRCQIDGTPDTNDMPGELSFWVNGGDDSVDQQMTIRADGKVGIGTSSPSAPLTVAGGHGAVYQQRMGLLSLGILIVG